MKAKLHALGRFRSAIPQALLEHLGRGRLDEDEHGLGKALANVKSTLDVDLENQRAFLQAMLDLGDECAVPMVEDLGPFKKIPSLDAAGELLIGEEVVVDAIDLTGARGPRGSGNRQAQVGTTLAHACDECPLPCS